mgnify:CR=1 FL=1
MFDVAVIIIIMYKSGIITVFIHLNTVLSNIKYVIDNKIIGIEINNDFKGDFKTVLKKILE